jgi:outer membrane murein-binding lipoprotein Lpp
MRVLSDKELRRLLDAADRIATTVEPLSARIAQLEAKVARLERVESAARAAGVP